MTRLLPIPVTACILTSALSLSAQVASDDASNYGSPSPAWTDGSNEGTGFAAWSLNNNNDGSTLFAGNFLGDSTAGAGNINTGGESFGMYANPSGAFSTAIRSFSSALSVNDQFSFQMALNFDNGNKGFNLRTAGDSIFNFNVGGGGSVSSPNATLSAGSGAGYDYGGNDAVLEVIVFIKTSTSLDYEINRTSSQGFQGQLFSGEVTGIAGAIDNFEFYISDTGDGSPQNDLYFNNLEVSAVPEPAAFALGAGCLVLAIAALRRRGRR